MGRLLTAWLVAVLAAVPLLGCGTPPPTPLLVIGVDGLEWDILLPLLRRGELPHLERIMRGGIYGELSTLEPTLSPVIWTTVATGRTPREHGITDFTRQVQGSTRLFTSRDRKVRALWNMLGEHDLDVNVVGWWNTWPAEPVNGVMVSQFSSLEQGQRVWKGTIHRDLPAQTYPPELLDELLPLMDRIDAELPAQPDLDAQTLPPSLAALLPGSLAGRTDLETRLIQDSVWAFRADMLYARVTLKLLKEQPAAVTMTYLGSADVAGHRFFRHYRPEAYDYPPTPAAAATFGQVIPAAYRALDAMVGLMVEAAGSHTGLLIISDHGMAPVNTGKDFEAGFGDASGRYRLAAVNSGHHLQAEPGVIIAAGPPFPRLGGTDPTRLRRDELKRLGSVEQVTPTLLYLMGLPAGRDMAGRVMADLIPLDRLRRQPPAYIETWETDDWTTHRPGGPLEGMDQERLRQLRSLGYVD